MKTPPYAISRANYFLLKTNIGFKGQNLSKFRSFKVNVLIFGFLIKVFQFLDEKIDQNCVLRSELVKIFMFIGFLRSQFVRIWS